MEAFSKTRNGNVAQRTGDKYIDNLHVEGLIDFQYRYTSFLAPLLFCNCNCVIFRAGDGAFCYDDACHSSYGGLDVF